jgi:hypothetical protein
LYPLRARHCVQMLDDGRASPDLTIAFLVGSARRSPAQPMIGRQS